MWMTEAAHQCLLDEADRGYPLETGGILLGYFAENAEAVVSAAIGPGPKASHSRTRFLPDHTWQCEQIDKLYEQSAGEWVYVGDWHTHPDASPQMSWLDQRTLRAIAKHPQAQTPRPVMMIAAGSPQNWVCKCHQFRRDRLIGLITECDESSLQIFQSR